MYRYVARRVDCKYVDYAKFLILLSSHYVIACNEVLIRKGVYKVDAWHTLTVYVVSQYLTHGKG